MIVLCLVNLEIDAFQSGLEVDHNYKDRRKFRLNFHIAPYFIMHAGHCQRKIMANTMQQLWDYALFLLFSCGEKKDYIH